MLPQLEELRVSHNSSARDFYQTNASAYRAIGIQLLRLSIKDQNVEAYLIPSILEPLGNLWLLVLAYGLSLVWQRWAEFKC